MSSSQTVLQLRGGVRRWAQPPSIPAAAPEFVSDAMADSPTLFMVGNSPAMLEVFDQVRRFAACDVPVLITGESGTGKELVGARHPRTLGPRGRALTSRSTAPRCRRR